jgi:hypothetical protein
MNKFKFSMLSIMMFCGVSGISNAAEIFDPQVQIAHSKELIDLANQKEIKSKTLEIAIMQNEIDKMGAKPVDVTSDNKVGTSAADSKLAEMQKTIDALKTASEKSQVSSATEAPGIFFTGFMEFSGKKQAEMIIDGSRKVLSVGDEIYPGLRIKSVSESGVIASSSSGNQVFTLKSNAQVSQKLYDAAFNKVKSESKTYGNQPMRMPSGPTPMAGF